jgi:hypothetical protein
LTAKAEEPLPPLEVQVVITILGLPRKGEQLIVLYLDDEPLRTNFVEIDRKPGNVSVKPPQPGRIAPDGRGYVSFTITQVMVKPRKLTSLTISVETITTPSSPNRETKAA